MPVATIVWVKDHIRIIDQTRLPERLVFLDIRDVPALAEAVKNLRIRGAPALGIAGAMGVALAACRFRGRKSEALVRTARETMEILGGTRPTAVNLFWALERMENVLMEHRTEPVPLIRKALIVEALAIYEEDRKVSRDMGRHGAALLPAQASVLTHCNAGGLATADYGTAVGVIYSAVEMGKKIKVFADETRPLLQGSRLTAWELMASGIDVTVICDSAAASLMKAGRIDAVLVGADRIAANGDAANKIGTYSLAVLAKHHGIPFHVVAPVSTIDFEKSSGEFIPIEQRHPDEVVSNFGRRTGPAGVKVYNPAFDVTPNALITTIVTEKGVLKPPFGKAIGKLKSALK